MATQHQHTATEQHAIAGPHATEPRSLMGYLQSVPDPRRRQARVYPLLSLLGMLVLAALNGESRLRRMGFRYVPDGRRVASARDDGGLAWIAG